MHNKHIRAMPRADASSLYSRIGDRWRATFGFRIDAVLHAWVHLVGQGPLRACGETLCGRTLLTTDQDDWENIVTKRHCPVCHKKLELLKETAQDRRMVRT